MRIDRFGTHHTTNSSDAIVAFGDAVHGVAAHRPLAGDAVKRALAADPNLVSAHALRGFANVVLARDDLRSAADAAHRDARAALGVNGTATDGEVALTDALGIALNGHLLAAADLLEDHLDRSPQELLHAKLAHSLRFMAGDASGMLAGTTRILDAWSEDAPGYGYLLGCHAFGLEEMGELGAAERLGRRAVELAPENAWALHAVSHVHEMQGRTDEGIGWIEDTRPIWTGCNNFSFHVAWHLALFHLERGDREAVLAVYDAEVRPAPSDDFRDMANAVSLLWRLEQEGLDVGNRWDELRASAQRRRADVTLTFASLHDMLALVAGGEPEAARELADMMGRKARHAGRPSGCDQAAVMNGVGCDLAEVILSLAAPGRQRATSFSRIAAQLQGIGGSHAQRDVFLRTLASAAASRGDGEAMEQVLSVRRRMKRDDRFASALRVRLGQHRVAAEPLLG